MGIKNARYILCTYYSTKFNKIKDWKCAALWNILEIWLLFAALADDAILCIKGANSTDLVLNEVWHLGKNIFQTGRRKAGWRMESTNWLALLERTQIQKVMESNQYTQQYGLTLSEQDAQVLAQERKSTLKEQRRVEFGESILPGIIYEFCDSAFISQSNYVESLIRLQEIFFQYKNEMLDEISDEELLNFMKEQFETVCFGDFDYLEGTCLDIFSQAVRAGYDGYQRTAGKGEYAQFDEVPRWDRELYLETLRELCWR